MGLPSLDEVHEVTLTAAGDIADEANGQAIMPYAWGHAQGHVKRRCRVIHHWGVL